MTVANADLEKCVALFHKRAYIPELPHFHYTSICDRDCFNFLMSFSDSNGALSIKHKSLLADRLLIYSIMMRKTPILTDACRNPVLVYTVDNLKELRTRSGTDPLVWSDGRLCRLNNRLRPNRNGGIPFHVTYVRLINETGARDDVAGLWGFRIVYDMHVGRGAGPLPNDRRLIKNKRDYYGFSAYGSLLEGKSK